MHWVVLIFNVGGGTWSACLSNVEQFVCFGVAHTHADLIVTDPSHLFDPAGILIMLQAVNHNISCKLLVTHQLQAVNHNISCKPCITTSAACRVHAKCIVSISGRRGVNLKPPALAWAWLPANMTWVMYTWGQFSHMRPPPTSPAMQLHSTHGHNVIPPSAHQTFSLPTPAMRICCDYKGK